MSLACKVKLIFLLALFSFLPCCNKRNDVFVVGIPSEWGEINPPIQYSVYADAIISNQFEPLIRMDKNGMFEPLAASSWSISPNFDELKFKIDTNRRFSNGKFLTAQDVKNSWEKGLLLTPKNAQSAFKDILRWVNGYENFGKTEKIKGLIVNGNEFTIKFKRPFRAALSFIANSRLGVFIEDNGHFIGTGQYVVTFNSGSYLEMLPNKYFSRHDNFSKIKMLVVDPEEAERKLSSGDIDAYLFAEKAIIRACLNNESKIKCISGREGRHEYAALNGLPNRFFSNPKYRKAIQALLVREIKETSLPGYMKINNAKLGPQVYLKFQLGRLDDKEALKIINEGNKYVADFIKATKKTPLYLVTSDKPNWIQEILQKDGIIFAKRSGYVPKETLIKYYHLGFQPDMLIGGVSTANGDPDNLYRVLGRYGSHTSSISKRPHIAEMLEIGRSLTDRQKINKHYQEISRLVLQEVPFVHIGFSQGVVAYRSDKVRVNTQVKNREVYGLSIFEPY